MKKLLFSKNELKSIQILKYDGNHFLCKHCGGHFNKQKDAYKRSDGYDIGRCKDCHIFDRKCKYYKNPEKNKNYSKIYLIENKEAHRKSIKKSNNKFKEANGVTRITLYTKNRRKSDPLFKLALLLRGRIRSSFKSKKWRKKNGLESILGISVPGAMEHITSLFQPGMSWDNHGEWHIDHIIPLSSAETEKEMYKLCHYTNLQPLWAKDNMSKGSKLNWKKD